MTSWIPTFLLCLIIANHTAFAAHHALQAQTQPISYTHTVGLSTKFSVQKGDLDVLLKRRMIRIAVPYRRTLFFNEKGQQRGLSADHIRDFERWINQKYKTGSRPISVYAIPTTPDKLLQQVIDGYADIAIGNITITPLRDAALDFSTPVLNSVSEMIMVNKQAAEIRSLDDLAGKTVYVRKSSSYYENLSKLNARFEQDGKAAIQIQLMPDALEEEDLMEMLATGIIDITVIDDWVADLWLKTNPTLNISMAAKLTEGGQIAWALREKNPLLTAAINEFIRQDGQKLSYGSRINAYQRKLQTIKNPKATQEWQQFEQLVELFKRYGDRYRFDYLMSIAQGFQESGLNQSARSPDGAIGIMQLMPKTGASLGVGDIRQTEPNVHAGVKYMRQLLDKNFSDAQFDETNAALFAFAGYNAGPYKIAKLRKEAQKAGLDPNKWFNNVELIVSERIGQVTVSYVRNIYKYYVAYKLALETIEMQKQAREQVVAQ